MSSRPERNKIIMIIIYANTLKQFYLVRMIGFSIIVFAFTQSISQSLEVSSMQHGSVKVKLKYHQKAVRRNLGKIRQIEEAKYQPVHKYKILCTAKENIVQWGSYMARCGTFKRWIDQCVPSVELTLGKFPNFEDKSIQYNATMAIKFNPPRQENWDRTFIDVIDAFGIKSGELPDDFEVIVQNEFQSELFPHHKTHIIEHWYNCDPLDTYSHEIIDASILKVGTVCHECPFPNIPKNLNTSYTKIDERKEGLEIETWFLRYMTSEGWTEEKMNSVIQNSEYASGILYYHVFRTFDLIIVTPKRKSEKLRYGSVQRITSVMKSGVPVLVEARGSAFEEFVDRYGYICVYSDEGDKYPSLEKALIDMHNVSVRKKCQKEGLFIAEDFSPDYMGEKLLRTLGYTGSIAC